MNPTFISRVGGKGALWEIGLRYDEISRPILTTDARFVETSDVTYSAKTLTTLWFFESFQKACMKHFETF